MKKKLFFVIYILFAVIILFGSVEVGFRLKWGRPYLYDVSDELMWVSKPGQREAFFHPLVKARCSTDSMGFRLTGQRLEEPVFRILTVGDSYTFCWGVEDDQAWPAVCEAGLRKRGLRVNVYNAGNGGYSTGQILARWRGLTADESFDMVIFGLTPGDEIRYNPAGEERTEYVKQRRRRALLKSSSLISVLYQLTVKEKGIGQARTVVYEAEASTKQVDSEELWSDYLPRWQELNDDPNSGSVVTLQLSRDPRGYSQSFIDYLHSKNLPFLDASPWIDSLAAAGVRTDAGDHVGHYSREVNQAIGRGLASFVVSVIEEASKRVDE